MPTDNPTFAAWRGSKETEDEKLHALKTMDALVTRCVAGEPPAWRELYRILYPPARSFLRHMGVSREDLDDVAQDVFLQVFRYLPRFQARAELKTWVYKICSSQASKLRRRRMIRTTLQRLVGGAAAATPPTVDADWGGVETRYVVEAALERMSEKQREVFVLYELHGLPGAEIAQIVGCPAATVRGRLREAREIFSGAVGDDTVTRARKDGA